MSDNHAWRLAGRTGRVVRNTPEFQRVVALPRRAPDPAAWVDPSVPMDHAAFWTQVLRRDDAPAGTKLRPEQGWALSEVVLQRGLLGNIECGGGKTWVSFLIPTVLNVDRALVILPASTLEKKTLKVDLPAARKLWHIIPGLRFISYEKMQRDSQHDLLNRLMPQVLICDEVHRLKSKKSVWRRIERFCDQAPETMFVGLSGTITVKSVRDYEHLIWLALRQASPLPHRFVDLEDLADAIDEGVPEELRPAPGALFQLCAPGETPREGFRRRLQESAGYVYSRNPDLGCSLRVVETPLPRVPDTIRNALMGMRASWKTPSGDTITSPLEFASHVDELLEGFFYRWIWPNGKPDMEWLFARMAWRSFVRLVVRHSGQQTFFHENFGRVNLGGMEFDTEMQVARAAAGQRLVVPRHALADPTAKNVFAEWDLHRNRLRHALYAQYGKRMVDPPREAVWLDRYLVDFAEKWIEQTERGLLWSSKVAFLHELSLRGVVVHGAGDDGIVEEKETCAVSIAAHGEGKNLQHFNQNLILEVPGSSKTVEQLFARTHRFGQDADEVNQILWLPTIEAWTRFDRARKQAVYVEATTGSRQKLNFADVVVTSEEEVIQRIEAVPPDPLWRQEWKLEAE